MPENAQAARAPKLGKTLRFMQLLWGLGHGLQSLSKAMESSLGISGPQRLVLRLIGRAPGISPRDLADAMRVHKSTLSGVLRRLEESGAVRREWNSGDGRRTHLYLTASGEELDAERSPTVEAAVRRAMLRIDPEDAEAARRVLETLIEELEREITL
jgi:MarR family transcriptional regulator, organic hydroperoxide resistance regulator